MTNPMDQVQRLFLEGSEFLKNGNSVAALACFEQVIDITAPNPIVLLHAGSALHNLERYEEAIDCYNAAVRIAPNLGEVHNNRGNSLMALCRFDEAAESFTQAVLLLPSSPVPLTARATAKQALGLITEAETDCRKALAFAPDFAQAHWNLALNLLLQGQYSEGWREYEWRWRKPDFTSPARHADIPQWDGEPLQGRTILLHAEQGFGDAIQFVRYAPLVAQLGGSVTLECHQQLVSLFQSVAGVKSVVPLGGTLPNFCYQAPLLSLPLVFNTTLENIPSKSPYLSPSTEHREKWAALMSDHNGKLRIGLIWAGKSYPDPLRSCRLSDFATLAGKENITFYSLQIGAGAEQASCPPAGMSLIDLTGDINDFSDTAALIEHLDLVISIDTATAHLAGAHGKPTGLRLPQAPDWRWLLNRNDSPWYPTMRLFRQGRNEGWGSAIKRVRTALDEISIKN